MRITDIDFGNYAEIARIEVIFVDFLKKPTDSDKHHKGTKYVSAELSHLRNGNCAAKVGLYFEMAK